MRTERLSEFELRLLEAGHFRFDGYSHAADVLEAHKLIRAGYVTSMDVGRVGYTCIECVISDRGRTALSAAGRVVSEIRLPTDELVL